MRRLPEGETPLHQPYTQMTTEWLATHTHAKQRINFGDCLKGAPLFRSDTTDRPREDQKSDNRGDHGEEYTQHISEAHVLTNS